MNRDVKQTLSRRVPPALWSLATLGICLGFLAAAATGRFAVREVDVVGKNVPKAVIVQAAGVTGHNLFTVRSDQVVRRLAGVHEVTIQRVDTVFPNRVVIYARARTPIAAWRTGTALYLIDRSGQKIKRVPGTTLPIISTGPNIHVLPPVVLLAVTEAEKLLPPVPHGAVAGFLYGPHRGLTINGQSGWQALVGTGSAQTLVNRIATLASFLQSTQNRPHLQLVDLRYHVPYATYGS